MNIQHLLTTNSTPYQRNGDGSSFWETSANNVFLPSSVRTASSDSTNHNETHNKDGLSSFADLSSDQNMICPLCKKVFRFEKNLLRHMQKTHATGEAESVLKCKLCNYTTRHYSNMYVHIRTHTGDKPYSCSGCGASFTQGSSLKLHIKSRHEDNTTLFSLTKKPGKNNLTKLWTRVYKKDLTKFANYGLGNYFSPFASQSSSHDFFLPFPNMMPYARVAPLSPVARYPVFSQSSHHFPMLLNKFPFLSSAEKSPDHLETQMAPRAKKSILSISNFVSDDEKDEYEENVSENLSVTDLESEETPLSFHDSLSDVISKYVVRNNSSSSQEHIFQLLKTLSPNVIQILKSSMSHARISSTFPAVPKPIGHQALLNPITDLFSRISDNIFLESQASLPGRSFIPSPSSSVMFGFSGFQPLMRMMDKQTNPFLP